MSKHFFKKELLSNGLRDRHGISFPFESAAANTGLIALDPENPKDAERLEDLEKISGTRGVIKISEKIYDELKKKKPLLKYTGRLKEPRLFDPAARTLTLQETAVSAPAATAPAFVAVAAVEPPAASAAVPVEISTFKPRVGRPRKVREE